FAANRTTTSARAQHPRTSTRAPLTRIAQEWEKPGADAYDEREDDQRAQPEADRVRRLPHRAPRAQRGAAARRARRALAHARVAEAVDRRAGLPAARGGREPGRGVREPPGGLRIVGHLVAAACGGDETRPGER